MKRVLILSYYFPPAGGSAVQRSLALAKYLPEFGWMPTVVTVEPEAAAYPDLDSSHRIPGVPIERTSAWDPYALYAAMLGKTKNDTVSVGFLGESRPNLKQRLARWIRANVFLPDARVGWVPFALARCRELIGRYTYSAVITTGPPHSTHLAGLQLKREYGLPWIADFRDAWTEIDYASNLPSCIGARLLDGWLERRVLESADSISVVGEQMRNRLLYGCSYDAIMRSVVIPNGFDPEDFNSNIEPSADEFVISHVGSLNSDRNPHAFWKAAHSLPIRVQLIGNVDPVVLETAAQYDVQVETTGHVPHNEAIWRMRSSTALLLVINNVDGAKAIATGKLYEYIASGRPVLGIGPTSGDAAKVLQRSGAGVMFGYEDVPQLALTLERWYERWAAGTLFWTSPEKARPYSRREQTKQYAALLASHIPAKMRH